HALKPRIDALSVAGQGLGELALGAREAGDRCIEALPACTSIRRARVPIAAIRVRATGACGRERRGSGRRSGAVPLAVEGRLLDADVVDVPALERHAGVGLADRSVVTCHFPVAVHPSTPRSTSSRKTVGFASRPSGTEKEDEKGPWSVWIARSNLSTVRNVPSMHTLPGAAATASRA